MSVVRVPLPVLTLALRTLVKRSLARERSPQAMRARLDRSARLLFPHPRAALTADTLEARGHRVPALWAETAPADAPVLLYLHGGAYLAGSPHTHAHLAAALGRAMGARACLPDYRLAPEHAFPAAVEDAATAYQALLERGHDPARIAVAGDSAGGGLAAALLLSVAEAGLPPPAALALFSPWADMTMRAESLTTNAKADAMLPAHRMPDVLGFVLQGGDPADPLASPALGRYAYPPPTLITVGTEEILLDDARALAKALAAGGGRVDLRVEPRLPHAWPVFWGRLRAADRTVAEAGAFLRAALG